MQRHEISDSQWATLRARWPQRRGPRAKRGDRAFVNAVVSIAKTGAPWRDVPRRYDKQEQTQGRPQSLQVRDHLRSMDGDNGLDCFELDDERTADEEVDASLPRLMPFVQNAESRLLLGRNFAQP